MMLSSRELKTNAGCGKMQKDKALGEGEGRGNSLEWVQEKNPTREVLEL